MAIQLRRGNEADLDISRLQPGETAVCLDTGKIIVKLTGGNYLTLTDTDAIQEIVAGKAAASHTHGQSDVTGLVDALAGKAAASHTHVKSDVTDLTNVKPDWSAASGMDAEILNKPTLGSAAAKDVGTGSNQVAAGNHNHAGVYAETAHAHIKELLTSRVTAPYNGSFTLDGLGSNESLTDYVCINIVTFVSTARQVVRMYRNHAGTDFFSARVILLGSTNAGLTSVGVATGVFSWGGTNKINYAGNGTTDLIVETVFGYK